jgi:hypothetical protein
VVAKGASEVDKVAAARASFELVARRLKESRSEATSGKASVNAFESSIIKLEKSIAVTERDDSSQVKPLVVETEAPTTFSNDSVGQLSKPNRATRTKKVGKAAQPVASESSVEVTVETAQPTSVLAAALNKLVFSGEDAADISPVAPKKRAKKASKLATDSGADAQVPAQSESGSPKPTRKVSVRRPKSAATEADVSAPETVATDFSVAAEAIASESNETAPKKRKTAVAKKTKATIASGEALIAEGVSTPVAVSLEGEAPKKVRKTPVRKPKALKTSDLVDEGGV